MKRILAALIFALIPMIALAQGAASILQGGPWSPGRVPVYVGPGNTQPIVLDSGPAGGGGLGASEFNITATGTGTPPIVGQGTGPSGTVFCIDDAQVTNPTGYHYLCFSANTSSIGGTGGLINYGAAAGASNLPLSIVVNGVAQTLGGPVTLVVGSSLVVSGTAGAFLTTDGTLLSQSVNPSILINSVPCVIGSSCTISASASQIINSSVITGGTKGDFLVVSGSTNVLWQVGTVPLVSMSTQASNTVLVNATGGVAAPTAQSVATCSAAADALIWTTNTGFGCNTSITAAAVPVGGITGLGTGVATALAINTNSSGGFVTQPVALTSMATQTANTVVANFTSGAAAPIAFAMVSCSASTAASNYTTSTGIGCNSAVASLTAVDQTQSGGGNITAFSIGTVSSGTTTIDCGKSPLQFLTNGGAFTLAAPTNDGSCVVLVTNNGSAGAITFSGFTVGSNTGDALTTTNTSKFRIFIERVNGSSGYLISAAQ